MSALPFLWSSGTITLSPWRRQDPALTALQENSVTTVASKLSFGICNAPQMEMFIWSCSTEASHWIKTSVRVTCGSYLSLQLPDTFPQKPCMSKPTSRVSLRRDSRPRLAIPHWLPRLAVMTGKHVLIAGSGSDKSRHVGASDSVSTICFMRTLVGTSHWFAAIWSNLIPLSYTPLHSPKTFNPYLSC